MPDILPHPASVVEALGKWAALIGSIIAVGQSATTWLRGYWQAKAEKQKASQALKLAGIRERSDLAQRYLKVILSTKTDQADRAVLLTALASIKGHPLQHWARDRYAIYVADRDRVMKAYKEQAQAAQEEEGSRRTVDQLMSDIDALNATIETVRDEPEKRQIVQDRLIAKSSELARAKAALSIAAVRISDIETVIARPDPAFPLPSPPDVADEIVSISHTVTIEMLDSIFPANAQDRIKAALPYLQAALQEFKIDDARLAAAIIATLAVEAPRFELIEENEKTAERYEGQTVLGNLQQGDGVRYRGRGYIMLTGRSNYTRMSERLGLGSRLVESPEDANSVEVASRILVAWFADRRDMLVRALAGNDLADARRAVAGAPSQLDRFSAVYHTALLALQRRQASSPL